MLIRWNRRSPRLHVAAAAAALHVVLMSAAGQAVSISDADGVIARAEAAIKSGRSVEAREMLGEFYASASRAGTLTEAQSDRVIELMKAAKDRSDAMAPTARNLAVAQVRLAGGEFARAELFAQRVLGAGDASEAERVEARRIVDESGLRRTAILAGAAGDLDSVARLFEEKRYAEAKTIVAKLNRAGLTTLPASLRRELEGYTIRLDSVEAYLGSPLTASAGALRPDEPGVVAPQDQPEPVTFDPNAQPEPPAQGQPIDIAMQQQAASLLAEADFAMQQARHAEASRKYDQVLSEFRQYLSQAEIQHAESRRAEAQILLRREGLQPDPDGIQIERQRIAAEFNNFMNIAERAITQGDDVGASSALTNAGIAINVGRDTLIPAERDAMEARLGQARQRYEDLRNSRLIEEIERSEDEANDEQKAALERARIERRERINKYLDTARAYQAELKYVEALETINQLLFLSPNDPAGLILRDVYEDIIFFDHYKQVERRKALQHARQRMDNSVATIPPHDMVTFPEAWESVSKTRQATSSFQDSPENQAVLAQLQRNRLPAVQLQDRNLIDVVTYLAGATNLNIVADWNRLSEVSIEEETPVNLSLRNVTYEVLLDRIIESLTTDTLNAPAWGIRDGIVRISSSKDIAAYTRTHIYDVSDMLLDVPDYAEVPDIDLQNALRASQGGGGGGQNPFRNDQQEDNQDDRRTLEERLEDIQELITQLVDFDSWVDNGGEVGRIYPYQRSLIITNTPSNLRQVDSLLGRLREQRAMQLNVEARFLLINQDFFEQIGMDLDVYINSNNNQVRAAQAVDPTIQGGDLFDFQQPRPLLRNVTGFVTPAGQGGGTGGETTQGIVNAAPWSPIAFAQDSLGLASTLAPTTGFASDILGGSPALGIAGQFLDDIQVDFLVRATQADRRSSTLTAPRVTFTNGQISNIYVATQRAFVSDLTPVPADSAVGFDPTIAVVTEGVTLLVEGTISADRRYVTMNVDTGVARLDDLANQSVSAVAGGQLVNSAQVQSFIQLPIVTVTRVRTTVNVPDQGTVLLGGQRLISEFEIETGVPVLSKIPILSRFFTNRIEAKEEQTLLILVKPTIIINSEYEAKNFPGLDMNR